MLPTRPTRNVPPDLIPPAGTVVSVTAGAVVAVLPGAVVPVASVAPVVAEGGCRSGGSGGVGGRVVVAAAGGEHSGGACADDELPSPEITRQPQLAILTHSSPPQWCDAARLSRFRTISHAACPQGHGARRLAVRHSSSQTLIRSGPTTTGRTQHGSTNHSTARPQTKIRGFLLDITEGEPRHFAADGRARDSADGCNTRHRASPLSPTTRTPT